MILFCACGDRMLAVTKRGIRLVGIVFFCRILALHSDLQLAVPRAYRSSMGRQEWRCWLGTRLSVL